MKKVAILQSNYIPWKGYFDIINKVDEFILYDDMQYTRRDWRNRNKIKTKDGVQWLTIPVDTKGKFYQKINETQITSGLWAENHWKSIIHSYKKSRYFEEFEERFKVLYEKCKAEKFLSRINYLFIKEICDVLGIDTKISWSSDYNLIEGKTERLASLVKEAGGDYYLSGPAAKDYIEDKVFENMGIELEYMDYSGYKPYYQLYGEFVHEVSIIDLLFNEGANAKFYLKSTYEE